MDGLRVPAGMEDNLGSENVERGSHRKGFIPSNQCVFGDFHEVSKLRG
jgi:hypothetical protein